MKNHRGKLSDGHRGGDLIQISGDYQYNALNAGHAIQMAWHRQRIMSVMENVEFKSDYMVLDVGCGSGIVAEKIAPRVKKVVAVDSNRQAIEFAKRKFKDIDNIEFVFGHADRLVLLERTYDLILCLEIIEHLTMAEAKSMLNSFHKLLLPTGKIVISTPNYLSHWFILEKIMDVCKRAPQLQDSQHILRFTKRRLAALLDECGYRIDFMRSYLVIAPFLACIGQKLSDRIFSIENKSVPLFGCDLVAIAKL